MFSGAKIYLVAWILSLCALIGSPVSAGAWMRDKGEGFVASSYNMQFDDISRPSVYFEYGAGVKWTLGGQLNLEIPEAKYPIGTGTVFVRKPLPLTFMNGVLAYEIGAGVDFDIGNRSYEPIVTAGISYGRGITLASRTGWFGVDTKLEWNVAQKTQTLKVDTTLGVNIFKKSKVMVQVFAAHSKDAKKLAVSASYVYDWTYDAKGKPQISLVLGGEVDALAPQNPQLKLGIWTSF